MRSLLAASVATSLFMLSACDSGEPTAAGSGTEDPAGEKTIAEGVTEGQSTFADAVKAAGLETTLAGPGPYTVLVPADAAFEKLPAGALESLMKEEARPQLTKVLTFHILPGAILAEDIGKAIDQGKGKTTLPTHGGDTLEASREGDKIVLKDSAGTKAVIVEADQRRTNGVTHVIDNVLMPEG